MPFQLSPGVNVTEIDLTTIVPAVASSTGAIAGIFNWGPVDERVLIDTETKLVNTFGKPNSNNAETWFTAANFLGYTNSLYVVRAANTTSVTSSIGAMNAIGNTGAVANIAAEVVKNRTDFTTATFDANTIFVAKYPGALGNSLKVSVAPSNTSYSSTLYANGEDATQNYEVSASLVTVIGNNTITVTVSNTGAGTATEANTYAAALAANLTVGDVLSLGNTSIGTQFNVINAKSAVTAGVFTLTMADPYRLATAYIANGTVNTTINRRWGYNSSVGVAPTTSTYVDQFGNSAAIDTLSLVVVDELGKFTGVPGTILETYSNLSRATDAKTTGGADNYFKTVVNQTSNYIWIVNDIPNASSANSTNITTSTGGVVTYQLNSGTDGYSESDANAYSVVATAYNKFASAEDIDVSLILQGKPIGGAGTKYQLANYLIDNIAEVRKDCVVFVSPDDAIVTGNTGNEAASLVTWRNSVHDTSYAVMDTGYKYMYDRYNDVYRYVPMNGDIAGLCARTDNLRDPWWSPAGFNRGQLKNLVKLRWNPSSKTDRDALYVKGINPIVSFPGQGTVLYGDKTLQSKPSAFDRINVRRLFIVLEKAISTASKFSLFEFNDEFTRSQFKNLITPYLRNVQARRGITDFLVVCDETNNTGEVIDRNEFIGDIYIKPARSINFIQLNFVAVRTGVQFSEIVGQF